MRRRAVAVTIVVALLGLSGCSSAPSETATRDASPRSELKVLACCALWDKLWAWYHWPKGEMDFLRAMNDDLVALGVTHKAISGDDSLLVECAEAKRTGLRLVVTLSHMSYKQGEWTGSHCARMWPWVYGLEQYGLDDYIDGFWVADDVTDDREADGHLLRQRVKQYFPDKEVIVSPTTPDGPKYVSTLREPRPDVILFQLYPYWRRNVKDAAGSIDEGRITRTVEERLGVARRQDGFWFQFFGCPDWSVDERSGTKDFYYAPRPGEVLGHMRRAWTGGKRGYYGIFTVLSYKPPGDPWIALYDHNKLMKTHDFKEARTYLWYEMREFVNWVHEREEPRLQTRIGRVRPADGVL